jgi:hypothetical protein|nr:MAG TPA: hypothetical protein [Caudoviricetes sp.]
MISSLFERSIVKELPKGFERVITSQTGSNAFLQLRQTLADLQKEGAKIKETTPHYWIASLNGREIHIDATSYEETGSISYLVKEKFSLFKATTKVVLTAAAIISFLIGTKTILGNNKNNTPTPTKRL